MKITYLSSAAVPSNSAHSLQVMKMCQAMEQEGHAVTLILPPTDATLATDDLERIYGVKIRFEIRRVELPPILGRRGLAFALSKEAAHFLPEMAYTRGIDIGLATAARGLRTVVEIHSPPAGWLGPFYLRMLLRNPSVRILTISRPLEEKLRRGYPALANRPILVAPDAVDLERYKNIPAPEIARANLGLPPKRFTAGYSGSLVAGRGVEQILEIADRLPEILFLILGGDEAAVAGWKRRAPDLENVRWLGHIPNADVSLHQAACDALLMPYQRQVTVQGKGNTVDIMSPLKLYEYMAAGRLILASDLPALRVILNETNSVLLPCDATGLWQRALEKAKCSKAWSGRLAERACRDVQPFTWRNRVQSIMKFAGDLRMERR